MFYELLNKLPDEICLDILKYVSLCTLLELEAKNRRIYFLLEESSVKNNFWKDKINQYFPYLLQLEPAAYRENPGLLFKQEYKKRKKEIASFGFSSEKDWEKSILGDLDFLENGRFTHKSKAILYGTSITNNHFEYINKLEYFPIETLSFLLKTKNIEAIECALSFKRTKTQSGTDLIKIFANYDGSELNNLQVLNILGLAIENNFTEIFQDFFSTYRNIILNSNSNTNLLLLKAKQHKREAIVSILEKEILPAHRDKYIEEFFYRWLVGLLPSFDLEFRDFLKNIQDQSLNSRARDMDVEENYCNDFPGFLRRVEFCLETSHANDFFGLSKADKRRIFGSMRSEKVKMLLGCYWRKDLSFFQRTWLYVKGIEKRYPHLGRVLPIAFWGILGWNFGVSRMVDFISKNFFYKNLFLIMFVLFFVSLFTGLPLFVGVPIGFLLLSVVAVECAYFGAKFLLLPLTHALGVLYDEMQKRVVSYWYKPRALEYQNEPSHTLLEKWAYRKGQEAQESWESWLKSSCKPLLWQKKNRDAYAAGMWDAMEKERNIVKETLKI